MQVFGKRNPAAAIPPPGCITSELDYLSTDLPDTSLDSASACGTPPSPSSGSNPPRPASPQENSWADSLEPHFATAGWPFTSLVAIGPSSSSRFRIACKHGNPVSATISINASVLYI